MGYYRRTVWYVFDLKTNLNNCLTLNSLIPTNNELLHGYSLQGFINTTCICRMNNENNTDFSWVKELVVKKHIAKDLSTLAWLSPEKYLNSQGNWSVQYVVDYAAIPLTHCTKFQGYLQGNGCQYMYDIFLMSVVLALGTFTIAFGLKSFRNTFFFPTKVVKYENNHWSTVLFIY